MRILLDYYFKLIKRMFPVTAQASTVGLDIGSFSCKAVEVSCKNGILELVRWAVEPVAEPDERSIHVSLSKVCSAFGLQEKPRPVIAALGGKGTLVRYVDMPKMSAVDLRRAFVIEADKYFPFPKDSIYTDCHVLDTFDANRRMTVLVAAIKKDMVDGRIKLLKDSGFDPFAISLNSVAIANVFAILPPAGFLKGTGAKEFKACAVVDIGESGTNLMIIFAGSPKFNRDIFIGTQEIYKRAANILGVSPAEARVLLSPGVDLQETAQRAIDAVIAGLITEIKLSFDYFITEKNLAIVNIFLAGEGALITGVERSFKENMDMPVAVWDPFEKMPQASTVVQNGLKLNSSRLITALGLALNEYDQD